MKMPKSSRWLTGLTVSVLVVGCSDDQSDTTGPLQPAVDLLAEGSSTDIPDDGLGVPVFVEGEAQNTRLRVGEDRLGAASFRIVGEVKTLEQLDRFHPSSSCFAYWPTGACAVAKAAQSIQPRTRNHHIMPSATTTIAPSVAG